MKRSERLIDARVTSEMVEIKEVVDETRDTKSFLLKKSVEAKPGQFAMLWLPGVDEKPMSFSGIRGETRFTIKKVGEFSERMHELAAGDEIGFRGPYGNGFSAQGKNVILLAGGCGAAPLLPLAKNIKAKNVTIIAAAKTKSDLMFLDEFGECGEVVVATDDGSAGRRGLATEVLAETILLSKFDRIYACGREEMLAKVVDITLEHDISAEVSTERYMKCGVGLCGQCAIGDKLVCADGPVFMASELAGTEFGVFSRNKCGARVDFDG